MEILKKNKVKLLKWLRVDMFIIQHVHSHSFITDDEYKRLSDISDETKRVTELLDLILAKGDSTCQKFLNLLKDDDVNESIPELRKWINSQELVPTSETERTPGLPTQTTGTSFNITASDGGSVFAPVIHNSRTARTDTSPDYTHHIKDFQEFLRKNRSALVDNIKNVDRIVDDLNLSDEMAAIVRAKDTDQEKMRKVFEFTNSKKAAELLVKALFTHRRDVMEDLIDI